MVEPESPPPVSRTTLAGVALFVAALVALLLLAPGGSPKLDPTLTDPSKIFAQRCALCHGPAGEGKGPFPKITETTRSEEEIVALLKAGKGDMPPFEATPEQRAAVARYVKGLARK